MAIKQESTADDWVRLALAARERGDHAEALEAFEQALSLIPDHPLLPVDMAYALFALGRDEEAGSLLRGHLTRHPESIHALVALGHHQRRSQEPEAALTSFERALILEPAHPTLPVDVALLQETLGFVAKAGATLETALTHHPESTAIRRELARITQKLAVPEQALPHLKTLLELEPENVSHPLALAASLLDAGQGGEAGEMLGRAREILLAATADEPGRAMFWHRLGQLEQRRGCREEAVNAFTAGVQTEPTGIECHLGLFWLAMDAPDTERAEAVLIAADSASAAPLRVSMMRAHLLRAQGKLDVALECAQSALASAPRDSEAIAVTGELLWQQGQYDTAEGVLETFPAESTAARGERARHHARLSLARFELDLAYTQVMEALNFLGADADLLAMQARIALMRGFGDEAHTILRERGELLKQSGLPASHPETVGGFNLHLVREYRVNPFAQQALRDLRDKPSDERIAAIAGILREEPEHFGTAHQLLIALRQTHLLAPALFERGRAQRQAASVIPRKIIQFWDQPEIPEEILRGMQSWPRQCLGFEHQIFNDASAHAFIKRACEGKVAKAYRQAHHPAMRADIFRLAYLAREGGIYADADDVCRRSIGDLLAPHRELVLMQEDLGSIGNNFICVRPNHPFILAALERVVDNVLKRQGDIIWFLTGPGAITQTFCLYFLDALAAGTLPDTVHVMDFYVLQQRLSMHLPRAYKRSALHWTSPDAAPLPLFMPG